MIQEQRFYWQERAREEFERAMAALTPAAREAHVDLALLHLTRCRREVAFCEHRDQCTLGRTCAVACRIEGLETLDVR